MFISFCLLILLFSVQGQTVIPTVGARAVANGYTSLTAKNLWSVFNTKKVRSRKTFSILLWMMIVAVAIYIFVPSASVDVFYIFLLPVTYFLAHYMAYRGNKKMANMMFAIIFISVLILQLS